MRLRYVSVGPPGRIMTTLSSYLAIARDAARWRTIASKQPEVALQTGYFETNIAKAKSAEDLVNNQRLFAYAMNRHSPSGPPLDFKIA